MSRPTLVKWSNIAAGTEVILKGHVWKVTKIKAKGKSVKVTVSGKLGEFARKMPAAEMVEISGEQWATERELQTTLARAEAANKARRARFDPQVIKAPPAPRPLIAPVLTPGDVAWDQDAAKADKRVRKILGGELLAVQVAGSDDYIVPTQGPSTIAAHLLIMHGVTADGVTIADAKAREAEMSQANAVTLVTWETLKATHDAQHADALAGKITLTVPHWHSNERPA